MFPTHRPLLIHSSSPFLSLHSFFLSHSFRSFSNSPLPFRRPSSPKGSFPEQEFPLPHDPKSPPITPPYYRSSTPPFRAENIPAFKQDEEDLYSEYLSKETQRQPETEQDPSTIQFAQQFPPQKVPQIKYQLIAERPSTVVYSHDWKHHPGVVEKTSAHRMTALSPEERDQIKYLREANPWKWTQGTLAKRFNVSRQEIMSIAPMPEKKLKPSSLKFVKFEKVRRTSKTEQTREDQKE